MDPDDVSAQVIRAMVLVPTKELAEQVSRQLAGLLGYCEKEVSVMNLLAGSASHVQR